MMTTGFWTFDDIKEAKRLVREIVKISELKGSLQKNDVEAIVSRAQQIILAVRNNKPCEGLVLPL